MSKVTFGIVNCNRLHYFKSCVESLLYCTEDYPDKEIILVDNASIEKGTGRYLLEKEKQGIKVIRREERDPHNEFAKALNTIVEESSGDYVCPLQGDMQFIMRGDWLQDYVTFYDQNIDKVGCILLDAQRRVRNRKDQYIKTTSDNFLLNPHRNPISGAADCIYSRNIIDMMYPWREENEDHEGTKDSETAMLVKVSNIIKDKNLELFCVQPMKPVSAAIFTDKRGTNARIRGNRRYGDYWPPKGDFKYYHILDYNKMFEKYDSPWPMSIEMLATPIGFDAPVDHNFNWLKNPIDPNNCSEDDYVELV